MQRYESTQLAGSPPIASTRAILRDGTDVIIRPVGPSDRARVAALFERMGALSIRHRFFTAKRGLSDVEVAHMLGDGDHHVVLAAVTGDGTTEVVRGLGRYVVFEDQPDTAEVAFEVGDADQGHGIGTLLLEHLARVARDRGVTRFRAEVEADNDAMLDVFVHSGFPIRDRCSGGVYEVEIPTADGTRFAAAVAARAQTALEARARIGRSADTQSLREAATPAICRAERVVQAGSPCEAP